MIELQLAAYCGARITICNYLQAAPAQRTCAQILFYSLFRPSAADLKFFRVKPQAR
jgi:hypothetical protein